MNQTIHDSLSDSEYLIISSSLRRGSRSRRIAERLRAAYREMGKSSGLIDLRDHPLPLCDGEDAYDDPNLPPLENAIRTARVIIVATPVYNYDANAAVKNLVELTGSAWEGKVVGFVCAAGGRSSYMGVLGLANSLMLDFRSVIIPRFIYATGDDFDEDGEMQPGLAERVERLASESIQIQIHAPRKPEPMENA